MKFYYGFKTTKYFGKYLVLKTHYIDIKCRFSDGKKQNFLDPPLYRCKLGTKLSLSP